MDKNINTMKETRGELTKSNTMLVKIKNNIIKNKMICYGVLALVVIATIIILYVKYGGSSSGSSSHSDDVHSSP
jgi:hypothetical protein